MTERRLPGLVEACEAAFDKYGDTFRGVGWTKSQENADLRYRVMLDVIRPGHREPVSLLDLGCGASHLLEHIHRSNVGGIAYSGLDLSQRFIEVSRRKFPDVEYFQGDILDPALKVPTYDYVVMNGLFTYKGAMSFDEMVTHWRRLVTAAMEHARVGAAFNTSSPYVDWQRDDLFHATVSNVTDLVAASACPFFVIRHDYGLYESTVYAYRSASAATRPGS